MNENEYILQSMISELELQEVVYYFIKFSSTSGKIGLCWTGILHIRMWFITLYDHENIVKLKGNGQDDCQDAHDELSCIHSLIIF